MTAMENRTGIKKINPPEGIYSRFILLGRWGYHVRNEGLP
jgi:hypothetical protein